MSERKYGQGYGFSPSNRFKLTSEVAAAAALTVVEAGVLPSLASNAIDVAGILLPLVEVPWHIHKIRKIHQERKASVHTPLRWEAENILHGQDTMFRKVDSWTDEMHGTIEKRVAASKRKEGQDILHMGLYSGLVLGGRVGLEVLSNVPHTGDGLEAFTSSLGHAVSNPDLLNPAWHEFLNNPGLPFIQTVSVIGAIVLTSAFNYQIQKHVTARLRSFDNAVDDAARRAKGKYDDTYLNPAEKVVAWLQKKFVKKK